MVSHLLLVAFLQKNFASQCRNVYIIRLNPVRFRASCQKQPLGWCRRSICRTMVPWPKWDIWLSEPFANKRRVQTGSIKNPPPCLVRWIYHKSTGRGFSQCLFRMFCLLAAIKQPPSPQVTVVSNLTRLSLKLAANCAAHSWTVAHIHSRHLAKLPFPFQHN